MKIKFVPQDLWLGLYWKCELTSISTYQTTFYLCLVPCFPIIWKGRERFVLMDYP